MCMYVSIKAEDGIHEILCVIQIPIRHLHTPVSHVQCRFSTSSHDVLTRPFSSQTSTHLFQREQPE